MDLETFREYCLTKIAAPESMPFGEGVLVFKVAGKMFALTARWNGRRSHSSTRWKKKLELALRFCRLRPARIAGCFSAIESLFSGNRQVMLWISPVAYVRENCWLNRASESAASRSPKSRSAISK